MTLTRYPEKLSTSQETLFPSSQSSSQNRIPQFQININKSLAIRTTELARNLSISIRTYRLSIQYRSCKEWRPYRALKVRTILSHHTKSTRSRGWNIKVPKLFSYAFQRFLTTKKLRLHEVRQSLCPISLANKQPRHTTFLRSFQPVNVSKYAKFKAKESIVQEKERKDPKPKRGA